MERVYHEVDFHKWCPSCKDKSAKEDDYDKECNECLEDYKNEYTDKPTHWREADD